MTVATKTISFSLNALSIDSAIRELERYIDALQRAVNELANALVVEGTEIAKLEVLRLGAFDTGELADSIQGFYDSATQVGIIRTDVYYAVFVEYGTGVVGERNAHPYPVGWEYDVNGHGDNGWVYHSDRDNKFHWTKGQPASPFMYNTFRQLQRLAIEKWKQLNI